MINLAVTTGLPIEFGDIIFGSSLKWAVMSESERSMGVKVGGPNNLKWTVIREIGRSKKL